MLLRIQILARDRKYYRWRCLLISPVQIMMKTWSMRGSKYTGHIYNFVNDFIQNLSLAPEQLTLSPVHPKSEDRITKEAISRTLFQQFEDTG
jgi:hypothetical protein